MGTTLQRAHSALLLKALLVRALRSLSVPQADLVALLDYAQSDFEDFNQQALISPRAFLKSLGDFISFLEKQSGKEFHESRPTFDPQKLDAKALSGKISKTLRQISKWAHNAHKSTKPVDSTISNRFFQISSAALEVAMGFDDQMVPEHTSEEKENMLIEEYKKLAGI